MEQVGILLYHFHWFKFFKHRLLRNFVFSLSSFFFKMSGIGNISNISHLVSKMHQVSINNIECDIWASMSEMTFSTDGWSAHINPNMACCDGLKNLFLSSVRI